MFVGCLFVSYLVSTTLQVSKKFSSGHLSSVRWSQSLDFFVQVIEECVEGIKFIYFIKKDSFKLTALLLNNIL